MILTTLAACGWLSAPPEPWVQIPAGTFMMGSTPERAYEPNELPQHSVTVPAFQLMRREVLASEYNQCVDSGACPPIDPACSPKPPDPERAAVCLDFPRAQAICAHLGGRLPTESEWEYAATSGGQPFAYPWGDEAPDCTRANLVELPVGDEPRKASCNNEGLWKPCTHPAGDTPWGLCEMGGNVFEWTEDRYHLTYKTHPTDGSAQTELAPHITPDRILRGGAIGSDRPAGTRVRTFHAEHFTYAALGVRCARSIP